LDLDRLSEPGAAQEPPAEDAAPYQRIADDLRASIACGALEPGDHLPTGKELAQRYGVSAATAHRAVALLTSAGIATASRGRRATVAQTD